MAKTNMSLLMTKKGVKNTEIARLFKVSEITVSAWRCGRSYVPPKHRQKLAETLGVKVEDILDARGLALLAEEEGNYSEPL